MSEKFLQKFRRRGFQVYVATQTYKPAEIAMIKSRANNEADVQMAYMYNSLEKSFFRLWIGPLNH